MGIECDSGKNKKLTPEEIEEFLAGAVVARVATIDENGFPYIIPVWQEWDGEAFWIVPRERSAWVQHIKGNPNVAVSCAQDSGTYKRILVQGQAEIVEQERQVTVAFEPVAIEIQDEFIPSIFPRHAYEDTAAAPIWLASFSSSQKHHQSGPRFIPKSGAARVHRR